MVYIGNTWHGSYPKYSIRHVNHTQDWRRPAAEPDIVHSTQQTNTQVIKIETYVHMRRRMVCPKHSVNSYWRISVIQPEAVKPLYVFQIHCHLANKHASKILPSLMYLLRSVIKLFKLGRLDMSRGLYYFQKLSFL